MNTTSTKWTTADYQHFYEERAAIAEYDGGLSRKAAEQQAAKEKRALIERHLAEMGTTKGGK